MDTAVEEVVPQEAAKVVTANGVDITYACDIGVNHLGQSYVQLPANLPPHCVIRVDGVIICTTGTPEEQQKFAEDFSKEVDAQLAVIETMRPRGEEIAVPKRKLDKRYRPLLLSTSIGAALKFERKH